MGRRPFRCSGVLRSARTCCRARRDTGRVGTCPRSEWSLASVLSESAGLSAGNPFHLHEFTPEELLEAVGKRLANQSLWNQHTQISSVLVQEEGSRRTIPIRCWPEQSPLCCPGRSVQPCHCGKWTAPLITAVRHMRTLRPAASPRGTQRSGDRRARAHSRRTDHPPRATGQTPRTRLLPRAGDRGVATGPRNTGALLLESEQLLARELATKPALQEEVSRLEQELADLRSSRSWQITARFGL